MPGRYGPYVKWAKVNATLTKGVDPENVTLDQALELIAAKAGASVKGKAKAAPRAKAATAAAGSAAKLKATKPKTAKPKVTKSKAAKPAAKPAGD